MKVTTSYHPLVKVMHGVMALVIIAAIALILYAGELPGSDNFKWELYFWHKSLGVLVGILIIIRLAVVINLGKPAPIGVGIQKIAASAAHGLLYLAMLIMPVSGFLMSYAGGHDIPFFGLFTIAGATEKMEGLGGFAHEVHEIAGYLMIALILLHVIASLYHHFILKDETMTRLFGRAK